MHETLFGLSEQLVKELYKLSNRLPTYLFLLQAKGHAHGWPFQPSSSPPSICNFISRSPAFSLKQQHNKPRALVSSVPTTATKSSSSSQASCCSPAPAHHSRLRSRSNLVHCSAAPQQLPAATQDFTQMMFDRVDQQNRSSNRQAGGAGGSTTYQAFLAADKAWAAIRNAPVSRVAPIRIG